jgi:ABC-2 type transport system ATP-binding protein
MDEADNADRIAVIDYGKLIAMDTPEKLKKIVGKDIITVKTDDDDRAIEEIRLRYQIEARHDTDGLHLEVSNGSEFLPAFIKGFGTKILSVSLRRPSLDDVFLKLTGREMREEGAGNGLREAIHQRRMRH